MLAFIVQHSLENNKKKLENGENENGSNDVCATQAASVHKTP